MRVFKRKQDAADVGISFANLALKIDEFAERRLIACAADAGLSRAIVERELRHLRVYILETALQSVAQYEESEPRLLVAYHRQLGVATTDGQYGANFTDEQHKRRVIYDEAWSDPRNVGTAASMNAAFARLCGNEDALLALMPLWLLCSSTLVEATKLLKSLRITQ